MTVQTAWLNCCEINAKILPPVFRCAIMTGYLCEQLKNLITFICKLNLQYVSFQLVYITHKPKKRGVNSLIIKYNLMDLFQRSNRRLTFVRQEIYSREISFKYVFFFSIVLSLENAEFALKDSNLRKQGSKMFENFCFRWKISSKMSTHKNKIISSLNYTKLQPELYPENNPNPLLLLLLY